MSNRLARGSSLLAGLVLLAGCGEDQLRLVPCFTPQAEIDVEQVSVLEGAYAIEGGTDSIVVEARRDKVPEGGAWRVSWVEVLVAIPESQFASFPADVELAALVWDADVPASHEPFVVRQALDKGKLDWTSAQLVDATSDSTRKKAFKRAWWRFDFTHLIPESGMAASRYLVGVRWLSGKRPLIGASHFDRPCADNWTDWDDGLGFVLNGAPQDETCNWPMFRVGSQIVTQRERCE